MEHFLFLHEMRKECLVSVAHGADDRAKSRLGWTYIKQRHWAVGATRLTAGTGFVKCAHVDWLVSDIFKYSSWLGLSFTCLCLCPASRTQARLAHILSFRVFPFFSSPNLDLFLSLSRTPIPRILNSTKSNINYLNTDFNDCSVLLCGWIDWCQ